MEPTRCLFACHPDPPLLYYEEGVGSCAGEVTRLVDVRSLTFPLYGALDCLDLLLLRGGRVINWDDKCEKTDIESKLVCQGHLSSLLIAWHTNPFCIMVQHKKTRPIFQTINDLRSILGKFGIKRVVSDKPWTELSYDSKQRKIRSVITFLDEIFKISAGEEWQSMKDDFKNQMKVVERDVRIEKIMHTICECLEGTSNKFARICVLKLVTGKFSEKEITSGTGASRYLIRQSKLTAFDEVQLLKNFKRERYDRAKELGKSQGIISPSDLKEFIRINCLGYSSAYKLMEVIAPNRQIRMSCVDSFQVSAFDAFDELACIVEELCLSGVITCENGIDLRRRITVCRNFMFGELRLHISENSNVLSHCWKHGLSDSTDPKFSSSCQHVHESFCRQCDDVINLSNIIRTIVDTPFKQATTNETPARHRLGRMVQICDESDGIIRSYRQHIMRCVSSEHDRRMIIDNLKDGEALITADYAMKILPTDAIERQSQWYAKAGISFHMCAIVGRINGELATHSFGHVSAISKQGFADREISLCKGKLNSYIDSGKPACTPSEILSGFTHNILLTGCSFHLIEVDLVAASKALLPDVKKYSSFRFQPSVGVNVKIHDAIGGGMIVPKEQLSPTQFKYTIHEEKGYLSQSEHFWKMLGSAKTSAVEDTEDIVPSKEDTTEISEIRHCPDMLCLSRFKTDRGLQTHLTKGKHVYYKEHESITDFALQAFTDLVESTDAAQIAVQNDSIVPLCDNYHPEETKKGWALRKCERMGLLDPDVKKEVERLIIEQLDNGRRAEAREIRDELRNMVCPDGSYRFTIKKCLSESQVKNQITRILNQRKKKEEANGDIEPEQSSQSPKTRGRKRKGVTAIKDNEKIKKRGRPSKKSPEDEKNEDNADIVTGEEEGEFDEDEINCVELMENEIQKMIDDIFDCE